MTLLLCIARVLHTHASRGGCCWTAAVAGELKTLLKQPTAISALAQLIHARSWRCHHFLQETEKISSNSTGSPDNVGAVHSTQLYKYTSTCKRTTRLVRNQHNRILKGRLEQAGLILCAGLLIGWWEEKQVSTWCFFHLLDGCIFFMCAVSFDYTKDIKDIPDFTKLSCEPSRYFAAAVDTAEQRSQSLTRMQKTPSKNKFRKMHSLYGTVYFGLAFATAKKENCFVFLFSLNRLWSTTLNINLLALLFLEKQSRISLLHFSY